MSSIFSIEGRELFSAPFFRVKIRNLFALFYSRIPLHILIVDNSVDNPLFLWTTVCKICGKTSIFEISASAGAQIDDFFTFRRRI